MITNDHGDVLELLDANGAAFAAYRYDPWGKPVGSGNYATGVWTQSTSLITSTLAGQIASRQMLRYASYAYDSESGLYYCSARYYDPTTRQWTTGDLAKADGEENAYQYCAGDPVSGIDPSGAQTTTTRYDWVGKNYGHPKWKATLRTRITWTTKVEAKRTYYKITEVAAKITDKQGGFYVLGHMKGEACGAPPSGSQMYNVYWPAMNDYVLVPSQRAMSEDYWYKRTPDWKGSPWHRPGDSGLAPEPQMWGAVRFYIYENGGEFLTCPNVKVSIPW